MKQEKNNNFFDESLLDIIVCPITKEKLILDKKTNGYNNIGIAGDEETHIKPSFVVLHWDGFQYRHFPDVKTKRRN